MARRVLLVEDDMTLRHIFAMVLTEAGFTVLEAESGEEALGLLAAAGEHVDVMVTDQRMPGGMSGTELMRAARRRHASLPLVGLTGAMPDPAIMADPALGGTCWLQKPILPDRLLTCVEGLIGPAS